MPKDILVDENNDLWIKNGDFVIGDSTEQHKAHLLVAQKGEIRHAPASGVGILDFLNDDDLAELGQEIQTQFERDNARIITNKVFDNGRGELDIEYND